MASTALMTKDQREAEWKKTEKNLPGKQNVTASKVSVDALANFFDVTLLDINIKLCKYSVVVELVGQPKHKFPSKFQDSKGKVPAKKSAALNLSAESAKAKAKEDAIAAAADVEKQKRKIKRDTERREITRFLAQYPVLHKNWASDYESEIVSVGPLWSKIPIELQDETPRVICNVADIGTVDLKSLKNHVMGTSQSATLASEFKTLNTISWKSVNEHELLGGRVGTKFYPQDYATAVTAITNPL